YHNEDLVFYGNQRELEFDFVIAPGADPGAIQFGVKGATKVALANNGDLVLTAAREEIRFRKPNVYQVASSGRHKITGEFLLSRNKHIGFLIGSYDASRPLVIDPILSYATYLGGTNLDMGNGI